MLAPVPCADLTPTLQLERLRLMSRTVTLLASPRLGSSSENASMTMNEAPVPYIPKVNVAKELAEISKDFTDPRELIRETISNCIDASAGKITIEAFKDDSTGDEELVVRVTDNGVGMNRRELEGFFDLGYSDKRNRADAIGHKGHGTKITYNSSLVTVFTKSIDSETMIRAVVSVLGNQAQPRG